jgi:hypothetical protein
MVLALLLLLIFGGIGAYSFHHQQQELAGWEMPVIALCGLIVLGALLKLLGVAILLLLAMTAILLYANQQRRLTHEAWAPKAMTICAILIVGIAGLRIVSSNPSGKKMAVKKNLKTEMRGIEACWLGLGKHLAQQFPDTSVLVLEYSWMAANKSYQDLIRDGLSEGSDNKVRLVAQESVPGAFTWEAYDAVLMRHPDCEIVISMPGMPTGPIPEKVHNGKNAQSPKLIVFTEIGLHENVARGIVKHEIAGSVVDCRNSTGVAEFSKNGGGSLPETNVFGERYVMLAPSTAAMILKTQQSAKPSY